MTSAEDIYIPAYARQGQPPHTTWTAHHLPCAVYVNRFGGLNGYVRLPETHPDRIIGHLAEQLGDKQFIWPDGTREFRSGSGYDHIDVPVHGGWTYGPDDYGWIGFDTVHGMDDWPMQVREQNIYGLCDLTMIEEFRILTEIERRHPVRYREEWIKHWTVTSLVAETHAAAVKLADRARTHLLEKGLLR